MADSVIIKISGDIKDFTSKLDAIQKETKDLSATLTKTGVVSSVAFATITAGAFKAVAAFKDSIKPGIELTNILKNQGIYSAKLVDEYGAIAKELKKVTGVDDEVITSGQAVIQRFIGQTKVTKELTQAILDFAAGAGVDTVTAFNLVGKTLGTTTNALGKYGIEIEGTLSAQEKMSVFIAQTNSKFRDQAKVLNESLGPIGRLKDEFGNVVENVGGKFAPTIDAIAGALENLAQAASENDQLGDIVASVALGVGALAGGAAILSSLATGFVAVSAAAAAAGVSIGVATGGLSLLAAAVAGLGFALLKTNKEMESLDVLTQKLTKSQGELAVMRKSFTNSFGEARALAMKVDEIAIIQRQITEVKKLSSVQDAADKKKNEQAVKDQQAAKEALALNKAGEDREKARQARLKDIEDQKKEREDLKKSLIDAGKSEFQALEDLRERRLKIAGTDAELRLQIETDFQTKKFALEKKNGEELMELRQAQADYEQKLNDERLKNINSGASNPLSTLANLSSDPTTRSQQAQGAAAGVLNQVGQGKEGARTLVTEGAALGIDTLLPGIGSALKPLLSQMTQGPEATKAFVKEFAEGIPEIVTALAESVPVLIEELSVQFPIIIDKLIEKVPDIIGAFVRAVPKIIEAQVQQAPKIIMSVIRNIPMLVSSFIDGLINGAGEFVQALIDAINPFSSDGPVGGVISGIGDFLGFAEGGSASVKRVPSGFAGDRFPAFLSSDELVVKPDVARDLESFLGSQSSSGGGNLNTQLLQQIAGLLAQPMTVSGKIENGQKNLADAILELTRNHMRLS